MDIRNGDGPDHSTHASPPPDTLDFDKVTLRAFLDSDPRPTVVLDAHNGDAPPATIVYRNKSMRQKYPDNVYFDAAFWAWTSAGVNDGSESFRDHNGMGWTRVSLGSRYTIVASENISNAGQSRDIATPREPTPNALEISPRLDQKTSAYESLRSTLPDTEYIQFFLAFDWSRSPIGPMQLWSDSLISAVRLLLIDPRPSSMMVGSDHAIVYNEAYFPIVGLRHPSAFGKPFRLVYPELPDFPPMLHDVSQSKEPIFSDNTPFTLMGNGYSEEAWFSYTLIPLFEPNQHCFAIYNPVFETTSATVADRRMGQLTRLGMATAASRSIDGFWESALEELKQVRNQADVFFGSLYAPLEDDVSSASSSTAHGSGSMPGIKKLKLVGAWNVPIGHPVAADELRLDKQTGLSPYFREASSGNRIVILHSQDDPQVTALLKDIESLPGEPCTTMVVVPVKAIQADDVAGFILCGINRSRPWNEDFAVFLQILSNVMSSSMAATVLVEEELRRSRIAAEVAAKEQMKLEEELLFHLKRAKALNMRFTEFAEKSPISIFVLDSEGRIIYANDLWREYTGYTLSDDTPMGWLSILDMTQVKDVEGIWHRLNVEHLPVSYETRLIHSRGKEEPPYVMCHAFPEVNEDTNEIENIIGSFTDITPTKKAELLQQKRSEDAIAAKKLQEAFVDITSHELRNPMAVVLLECESIINSLANNGDINSPLPIDALKHDALASTLDAAKTIMHCVTHQRRIVDDILTLSKLDSDLLPVAPTRSNVMECVNNVISMFVSELKAADIAFELIITESFKELEISDVYVDPSRLAQVFINLLTNAIKFTNSEATRKITVRLAASLTRPTESSTGVVYISQSKNVNRDDITEQADWGNGPPIYLMFAVTDTGRGLTTPEMDMLFRRFSQASPRTHVQYGGSGLGLYISRELTEKQGGQIGVSSIAGSGSTFAFYIKSKRAEAKRAEALPSQLSQNGGTLPIQADTKLAASLPERKAAITETDNADIPVLIVEDNLVNRRVLKKALTRLGFPILEAGHGEEALDIIKQSKYWSGQEETGKDIAVMLLDWEMPVLDGIGCIRKVRELEAQGVITAHLNTIAVTANARKEQIDIAMEAGMDDLISKPFTTELLVQQIKKWASSRA